MRLRLAVLTLAVAGGCRCGPAEAPEPEVTSWAPPPDPQHVTVVPVEGGPAVAVQFTGVGTMYRSWFADAEVLGPFAEALRSCIDGPIELAVTYDEDTRRGRVALVTARSQLRCFAQVTRDGVDLASFTAVSRPVAGLRNRLAGLRDIRIYGFATAVHVEDERGAVTLWLEGQDPIDGSAFGPCLGLDGVERCVEGGAPDGLQHVALPERAWRKRLQALLGPG